MDNIINKLKLIKRIKPFKPFSVIINALKPTIPRKIKNSGHFHLNTTHHGLKVIGVTRPN